MATKKKSEAQDSEKLKEEDDQNKPNEGKGRVNVVKVITLVTLLVSFLFWHARKKKKQQKKSN